MGRRQTSAPAEEPLTLAQAKAHLRVTDSADDTLIGTLITAAREWVENATGRALITQQWELTLDAWPSTIRVPLPPLQSVTSIAYTDADDSPQALAGSEYAVDAVTEPGRIRPASGKSWPVLGYAFNAITVAFQCGYGDASQVPQAIKQALLLIVGHLYENREAVVVGFTAAELPIGVDALLGPYTLQTV